MWKFARIDRRSSQNVKRQDWSVDRRIPFTSLNTKHHKVNTPRTISQFTPKPTFFQSSSSTNPIGQRWRRRWRCDRCGRRHGFVAHGGRRGRSNIEDGYLKWIGFGINVVTAEERETQNKAGDKQCPFCVYCVCGVFKSVQIVDRMRARETQRISININHVAVDMQHLIWKRNANKCKLKSFERYDLRTTKLVKPPHELFGLMKKAKQTLKNTKD